MTGYVRAFEVVVDQAQEGRRRRETRQALHQARAGDHRRRARRRRRPRRQPDAGDRDPEGARRLDAEGQHPAGDRPRHRRRRRRRRDRADHLRGLRAGGVAVLVEALTDNRNRASAEIRFAFSSHGGSLGEPGSVAWIFEKKGAIVVDGDRYGEDDLIVAIDAGAEDVREDGEQLRVLCDPSDLTAVREALEGPGSRSSRPAIATEPKSTVELKGHDAERLLKLLDALDDQDDVDEVFANFDIPEDVLEKLAA